MSALGTWRCYRALRRTERLDPGALRRLQARGLRRLVDHAVRHTPFWRRRFAEAGVDPASIRAPEDLVRLPVTTKAELIEAGPEAITSAAFAASTLAGERTSGSTGRPFTLRYDRAFADLRRGLFLRALAAAGHRPWSRLLLVTARKPAPRGLPWRYAGFDDAPEALLEEIARFRPAVIYGWVTPLRRLAQHLEGAAGLPYRPRALVTTAETLDESSRALLARAFRAPVLDAYGLTETGFLAFECPCRSGYHVSEDTALVELLPAGSNVGGTDVGGTDVGGTDVAGSDVAGREAAGSDTPGGGDTRRIVVTNLALLATPLLRFDTGDLARWSPGAPPCPCGRTLRRLEQVEGRLVDCVRLPGGRVVPPYRLTLALEPVAGLRRYQVVQEGPQDLAVRFEGPAALAAIRGALAPILGPGVRVHPRPELRVEAPPGRKFRVVECRLA